MLQEHALKKKTRFPFNRFWTPKEHKALNDLFLQLLSKLNQL